MVWNESKFGSGAVGGENCIEQAYDSKLNREGCSAFNVLASQANWAWPDALRNIFKPRGVNLLVAENANQFVSIMKTRRIHTTIVDVDSDESSALATIKIIRMDYPLTPCILLSSLPPGEDRRESFLGNALKLNVFSVIDKPVDMGLLRQQLDRLFVRKYNSNIFGSEPKTQVES